MRVVVDTSVWSLVLRRSGRIDHPQAKRLDELLEARDSLALTGAILQEVLQAFRRDDTVEQVQRYLAPFPLLELERETFVAAAHLRRRCAARGIAASTVDCQIAAAAIAHGYALLTADADFGRMATVCELELV